jgi:hypothetical protein
MLFDFLRHNSFLKLILITVYLNQGRIWTKFFFNQNRGCWHKIKMSFSETGSTCIYLSVLNVKFRPRAKIKNLYAFFCISGFHDLPPVNLSKTYFRGLRGKAMISKGIDFFVLWAWYENHTRACCIAASQNPIQIFLVILR